MKLPERDCYTLEEVARRWECEVSEVHHFIAMDLLRPSIYVSHSVPAIYFTSENVIEDGLEALKTERHSTEELHFVSGLVYLRGYRTGPMKKRFTFFYRGPRPTTYLHVIYTEKTVKDLSNPQLYAVADLEDLSPNGEIPNERLVIAAEELARFEAEYINPSAESHAQSEQQEGKPLTTNERNTLLVLIAALCKKAGIDPAARTSAGELTQLARADGINVEIDRDTVRDKLKQIPDALGARQR